MHAIISIATAAALFMHAVLGCCWHHAHACQHDLPLALSAPASCCPHHHSEQSSEQHHPDDCRVDCEGGCQYVAPEKIRIEAPRAAAALDFVAVLPAPLAAQNASFCGWQAVGRSAQSAPPLRLHLLHQLLLI